MITARIPFAAVAGVLCSLAVFFGLWRLVGVPLDVNPAEEATMIDFTRQVFDTPVQPKPHRTKPERQPRQEVVGRPTVGPGDDDTVIRVRPDVIGFSGRSGIGRVPGNRGIPMGVDRDATPVVRPDPEYPTRYESRGIEGWVHVQFDVTATGTVRNAFVVAAEPRDTFEEAALEAIARWRYHPRIVHGDAVERVGLQTLIRFELEERR